MFYTTIGNVLGLDQFDLTSTDDKNIASIPLQLAPHFMIKDPVTGETREHKISDKWEAVFSVDLRYWHYANLQDVIFYVSKASDTVGSTNGYLTADKEKMYCYFANSYDSSRKNNGGYVWPNRSGVSLFPVFEHIEYNGKDYLVRAQRLDEKTMELTPLFHLNPATARTKFKAILDTLCDKYGLAKLDAITALIRMPDDGTFVIGAKAGGYYLNGAAIIIDDKTPFPDCYLPNEYVSGLGYKVNTYLQNHGTNTTTFYEPKGLPEITHRDYYNYDQNELIGTDVTGKIKLYNASYINAQPDYPIILEPIHKLGLSVFGFFSTRSGMGNQNKDSDYAWPISNFIPCNLMDKFTSRHRNDFKIYCGERSYKLPYQKRPEFGGRSGGLYMGLTAEAAIFNWFIESKEDNSLTALGWCWDSYNQYPIMRIKNATIHTTPKNENYDYYGAAETADLLSLQKDSGLITQPEKGYVENWPCAAVLQKGFTGKTTMSNPADYATATAGGKTADPNDFTCRGFRDWDLFYMLTRSVYGRHIFDKNSPTQTVCPWTFTKGSVSNYPSTATSIDENAETILIDAQFDYFNEIFTDAPLYIVDTKVLGCMGFKAPEFHRFMPNRCIWFEVDDLYTYDNNTGKITGFNTKYISATDSAFIYDLNNFTKFKARYFEQTKEVLWDTKVADKASDFTTTGTPTLKNNLDISDFIITVWKPLQKAIFMIDGLTLDTGVA